jgi:hypothetical protein
MIDSFWTGPKGCQMRTDQIADVWRELRRKPTVYVTYVDHEPSMHPVADKIANLVRYANGPLTLSTDKKKLSATMRMWRNIDDAGGPTFDGPAQPPDVFDDPKTTRTITIVLSDSGQVTCQMNDAKPGAATKLNAAFANAMYLETSNGGMRSLSFTLGT